jgi:anthranilate phosphoribosyltransferase
MSKSVFEVLHQVASGKTLDEKTAEDLMNRLMQGEVNPLQTAGLLAAMAVRGESVDEIVGFARAMRNHSVHLDVQFETVDTCGTGGDGADTFNISTATAIVSAAAGVRIAKHGNRAVSSKSGSADVLQALGVNIEITLEEAKQCLMETNLCFLFAPSFHPAMKHAVEPRRQLGFRTIFNVLGPLTNPAGAKRQVLGVFREDLVPKVAEALRRLGCDHALVIHGAGGIDEFSLAGDTYVAELKDGQIREYTLRPESVGLATAPLTAIAGGDANFNASIIRGVLEGMKGPCRDVVAYNAGAVLYVSGICRSIQEGVKLAEHTIDTRKALDTFNRFRAMTNRDRITEVVS